MNRSSRAELVSSYVAGTATAGQRAELLKRCREDSSLVEELADQMVLERLMGLALGDDDCVEEFRNEVFGRIDAEGAEVEAFRERVFSKIADTSQSQVRTGGSRRRSAWWQAVVGVAAAAIILAGVLLLLPWMLRSGDRVAGGAQPKAPEKGPEQDLEDGSREKSVGTAESRPKKSLPEDAVKKPRMADAGKPKNPEQQPRHVVSLIERPDGTIFLMDAVRDSSLDFQAPETGNGDQESSPKPEVVPKRVDPPALTPVSLPFSDDFGDKEAGRWYGSGGTWIRDGSKLLHRLSGGINSYSIRVPALGGEEKTGFVVGQTFKTNLEGRAYGFGLLSECADFGVPNNRYYLVDIGNSSLRIAEINVNEFGRVNIGDTGLQTTEISFSPSETYTLTAEVSYGEDGLTIVARLDSDGDENGVTLKVTDPSPLTGQHFGFETFGGGSEVSFDDFRIEAVDKK